MKKSHIYSQLPENYKEVFRFEPLEDIETLRLLSHAEILITAALLLLGLLLVPIKSVIADKPTSMFLFLRFIAAIVGVILVLNLHELTHALFMKIFGSKTVHQNMDYGMAATCSNEYYDRFSYIIVVLAPMFIYGAIGIVIACLVSKGWFWAAFPALIVNFSGSVSDIYSAYVFAKMPKDMLVKDDGVGFTVYTQKP